jgi:hypothetical protein
MTEKDAAFPIRKKDAAFLVRIKVTAFLNGDTVIQLRTKGTVLPMIFRIQCS